MTNGIVFGKGFLGSRLSQALNYQNVGREHDPLDIVSLRRFLDEEKPKVVINAIGATGRPNIDWCETHVEETFQSNVSAAVNLATECSKRKIYFVNLGSGCIYQGDNNRKGFSEEDAPNYFGSLYSRSKIIAQTVLSDLPGLNLRLRMPIDDRPNERNLIDKLRNYPKLIDTPNSMTTVPHMIGAVKNMINRRLDGTYNLVNPGTSSAFEVISQYKEIVDSSHRFELLSLEGLKSVTSTGRSNCYLSSRKLASQGIILPEINTAIRECLLNYRGHLKSKE